MKLSDLPFAEVVVVDFEFVGATGENPQPVCLVAHELVSGNVHRLWQDTVECLTRPPYPIDDDTLMVAYYGSAEVGCHLSLGWQPPTNLLDLYAEFRVQTNGLDLPLGSGLLGAATFFGLDGMDATTKDDMRDLILRGGPWSEQEQLDIVRYCESDVVLTTQLLHGM